MKRYHKKFGTLNVNTLIKLNERFAIQKWEREENDLFERFCKMLSGLSEAQQALILELTRDFLKIDLATYPMHIRSALSEIESVDFIKAKTVFVMPLLQPEDFGKSKSSTTVAYLFQDPGTKSHYSIVDKNVFIIHTPEILSRHLDQVNNKDNVLLLVDDFIGTGETATNLLNFLIDEIGVTKNKIVVLALVAQEQGINTIESFGVDVYYSVLRKKGITDSYVSPTKEQFITLMSEIENNLKVNEQFRLGYKGSESLVTLIRTPNNTFPVFWFEPKLKNKEKVTAPFPR